MVNALRKLSRFVPLGTRRIVQCAKHPLTGELIRLLPLIPAPFLGGKLLLAQRLMKRHQMLVPLLVAGHRLVQRSRR